MTESPEGNLSIHKLTVRSGVRHQVKWRRLDGTQASKTFKRRKYAVRFEATVLSEKGKGNLLDERRGKVRFEDYVSSWRLTKTSQLPSTATRRDGILNKHFLPTFGNRAIASIKYSEIQNLVTKWQQAGLAPRTIRQHIQIVRPIFDMAVRDDVIHKNPCIGVTVPKPGEVTRHPLTPEECSSLLRATPPEYLPFIYTVLSTGLRFQEATSLLVGDLDLVNNELKVTKSKTAAGRRTIALSERNTKMLQSYLQKSGRLNTSPDEVLFTSPLGKPIHSSNFRKRVFIQIRKAAGLENVTFHDLRRTQATALAAMEVNLKAMTERMGHTDAALTMNIYAKATEKNLRDAATATDLYLGTTCLDALMDFD